MPHCIIEHSENIRDFPSWEKVFKELHEMMVNTGGWIESEIKSRVVAHSNYYIGDGSLNQTFITLNIQILDGRSEDLKKEISQNALKVLSKYFEKTFNELQTSITVQISDIHSPSYSRKIS
ncbi:MAG: 5-carboxymethyl-2-hydroxymuconate Delta-isomerase [Desulfobacteraceae bacterium]|nr:5-carboxymethyl-2-hydroxymuconate Delta-isomerase [Desulfobacteraceae bacterium]